MANRFVVSKRPNFYGGLYHHEYKLLHERELGGGLIATKSVGDIQGSRRYVQQIADALNTARIPEPPGYRKPWKPTGAIGKALRAMEKAGRR